MHLFEGIDMKKRNILVVLLIALPIFSTIGLACSASINALWYSPADQVSAGGQVTIHTTISFHSDLGQTCSFLIEDSIIHPSIPWSILPSYNTLIPNTACCQGNEIYADATYTMDYCLTPIVGCTQTYEVVQAAYAPSPTSYDHCCADTPSEPQRCQPGFYWKGQDYYTVTSSIWSACHKVDPNHVKYDGRLGSIYVTSGGGGGCPTGQQLCSDGICRVTCGACTNFWTCPIIWVLTGEDLGIIAIFAIVLIFGIYYIRKGGKNK
jgi:hypothetical protein